MAQVINQSSAATEDLVIGEGSRSNIEQMRKVITGHTAVWWLSNQGFK